MDSRDSAAFRWGATAVVWLLGIFAVAPLVGGHPIAVAAQVVIEVAPGPVATVAIETLGGLAQPALMAGIGILAVATAAGIAAFAEGYGTNRRQQRLLVRAVTVVVVVLTAAGFRAAGDGIVWRWTLATAIALAGPALLRVFREGGRPTVGRRRTLRNLGGAAGVAVGGGLAARSIGGTRTGEGPDPGESLDAVAEKRAGTTTPDSGSAATPVADRGAVENRREVENVVVSVADTNADFGYEFTGMPAAVGSADDHYVVDKAVSNPNVDAGRWSLSVRGAVAEPFELDLSALLTHAAARDMTVTTACISNVVGGDLISTAEWRAVPVRALLAEAGVADGAVDVVTRAADGYTEAIPWEVVRDREDVVLAVGMDGRTLPKAHGFPARLLIPGRYGMKSTKWVEAIEVSTGDHEGYWEARGWVEEAVVNTLSSVRAVQRRGDRVAVGGVAYAGRRGIDRVEVSLDGGDSWADAALEDPPSTHAWRRFRLVAESPDSGPKDVVVRATDGEGNRQTREETGPHPGGSTGWHGVTVSL
ncbi:molybdopterin-dependent oxidoreductase [Halosimplex aquaticum]|uniref:Molybdopterin-dependent oxidoreductase n=1 Tax=Halosimplex aquaticum TaxID=3026162 RepID=A0ABD5Y4Q8_9EURY|nr:molybdopterin-dependent oxidoreductase [Halosimplex aquaticum]